MDSRIIVIKEIADSIKRNIASDIAKLKSTQQSIQERALIISNSETIKRAKSTDELRALQAKLLSDDMILEGLFQTAVGYFKEIAIKINTTINTQVGIVKAAQEKMLAQLKVDLQQLISQDLTPDAFVAGIEATLMRASDAYRAEVKTSGTVTAMRGLSAAPQFVRVTPSAPEGEPDSDQDQPGAAPSPIARTAPPSPNDSPMHTPARDTGAALTGTSAKNGEDSPQQSPVDPVWGPTWRSISDEEDREIQARLAYYQQQEDAVNKAKREAAEREAAEEQARQAEYDASQANTPSKKLGANCCVIL